MVSVHAYTSVLHEAGLNRRLPGGTQELQTELDLVCQHIAHLRTVEAKLRGELTERSQLATARDALAAEKLARQSAEERLARMEAQLADKAAEATALADSLHRKDVALADAEAQREVMGAQLSGAERMQAAEKAAAEVRNEQLSQVSPLLIIPALRSGARASSDGRNLSQPSQPRPRYPPLGGVRLATEWRQGGARLCTNPTTSSRKQHYHRPLQGWDDEKPNLRMV